MMKKKSFMLAGVIAAATLAGCGNNDSQDLTTNGGGTTSPSATSLGGFALNCEDQNGSNQQGQQKQVPYQQQQSCTQQQSSTSPVQQKQKLTFKDSKVSDFDVTLACDRRVVVVKNKGFDQKEQTIPISSDGSVKGTLSFQQQIQNDGKGHNQCYIGYVVNFDGKTNCSPQPTPTATLTATPPSSSNPGQKSLQFTTVVDFRETNSAELRAAGISLGQQPGTVPSPTPTPSVSPSVTPSASPSVTPSATPTPSVTPTATPTVTVTPVEICVVTDPCPIEGKGDLSCGQ
ncbi:MAG: hypothetical protein H7222_03680 [Methylotenera sp.]|nr:hypothetical protein [Oligoflexia bacterium]